MYLKSIDLEDSTAILRECEYLADKFLFCEDISHYGFKSFKHFRRKNVF